MSRKISILTNIFSNGLKPPTSYGGFLKWWYPQIIHFNRVFHYKPSILGYPYFWKHPTSYTEAADAAAAELEVGV